MAKDTQIRCEMTDLAQGRRIVAPLKQHPWTLDIFLNEARNTVRLQGPLTRTISKNPIVAVVTSEEGNKVKFRWTMPGLRAVERRMSGFYKFQASLDLTLNMVFLRVGDDRPHGTAPAFVTGKCRKI
ncbi:hypothetical protein [Pseudophaeobacter sp.]|uniref:hypothetical protein n=1 Tax=Pseudophaeobacter sp. TaxID=1971739 RepID=UPI003297B13C